jgi:hypothetical protein
MSAPVTCVPETDSQSRTRNWTTSHNAWLPQGGNQSHPRVDVHASCFESRIRGSVTQLSDLVARKAISSRSLLTLGAKMREYHRRAPYMGLGDDPPPACPHDRARRRHRARRHALGASQTGLLPTRAPALEAVPAAVPVKARRGLCRRPSAVLRPPCRSQRAQCLRCLPGAAAQRTGSVYAKPPFAGPEAALAYLSRCTHRVAISNSRLIALDEARSQDPHHLPRCDHPPCNGHTATLVVMASLACRSTRSLPSTKRHRGQSGIDGRSNPHRSKPRPRSRGFLP